MVCLGNICRSPLAEGILKNLTKNKTYLVDSAGTSNYHPDATPDPRSIIVAAKNGIDISTQQARQISIADLDRFDHILVMDQQNLSDVLALCSSEKQQKKVALITQAGGLDVIDIPDPYYGDEENFEYVFSLLHESCTLWLAKH